MENINCDVCIIGGGPGGYVAAIRASQLGAKVILIEKDKLGGVCLNHGCIPAKTLLHSSQTYRMLKNLSTIGINVKDVSFDFKKMHAYKKTVVNRLFGGINYLMRKNGVSVLSGTGSFLDSNTIICTASNKKVSIGFKKAIIATGSTSALPPIQGINGKGIVNSDYLINMERVPESILIIGGGAVGVEFASIYNSLGSRVTIIEMMDHLLPELDSSLGASLFKFLTKEGINIHLKAKVVAIQELGRNNKAKIEAEGQQFEIESQIVAVAAGRKPYTEGLGLQRIGIKMNGPAIFVDNHMNSSIDNIYAIGDVVGGIQLAHVASKEGIVASENAMGMESEMDYKRVPFCIYTDPEIASIGMSEEEASNRYDIVVSNFPFEYNGKALASNEAFGNIRLVVDKKNGEILGVHIIGSKATELIGEAIALLNLECTAEELANIIHPHPTLTEVFSEAANAVIGQPIHS